MTSKTKDPKTSKDLKNSSVRGQAGPIYAASFLEEFVGEGPWAHVDVAGTADTAVRAVSFAITRPVQLIAGLAEGVAHGFGSLRVRRSARRALLALRAAPP